jgi:hypothetical protein
VWEVLHACIYYANFFKPLNLVLFDIFLQSIPTHLLLVHFLSSPGSVCLARDPLQASPASLGVYNRACSSTSREEVTCGRPLLLFLIDFGLPPEIFCPITSASEGTVIVGFRCASSSDRRVTSSCPHYIAYQRRIDTLTPAEGGIFNPLLSGIINVEMTVDIHIKECFTSLRDYFLNNFSSFAFITRGVETRAWTLGLGGAMQGGIQQCRRNLLEHERGDGTVAVAGWRWSRDRSSRP